MQINLLFIKPQLTTSCILIRIKGAINDKIVSIECITNYKKTWYNPTFGELSIYVFIST